MIEAVTAMLAVAFLVFLVGVLVGFSLRFLLNNKKWGRILKEREAHMSETVSILTEDFEGAKKKNERFIGQLAYYFGYKEFFHINSWVYDDRVRPSYFTGNLIAPFDINFRDALVCFNSLYGMGIEDGKQGKRQTLPGVDVIKNIVVLDNKFEEKRVDLTRIFDEESALNLAEELYNMGYNEAIEGTQDEIESS